MSCISPHAAEQSTFTCGFTLWREHVTHRRSGTKWVVQPWSKISLQFLRSAFGLQKVGVGPPEAQAVSTRFHADPSPKMSVLFISVARLGEPLKRCTLVRSFRGSGVGGRSVHFGLVTRQSVCAEVLKCLLNSLTAAVLILSADHKSSNFYPSSWYRRLEIFCMQTCPGVLYKLHMVSLGSILMMCFVPKNLPKTQRL